MRGLSSFILGMAAASYLHHEVRIGVRFRYGRPNLSPEIVYSGAMYLGNCEFNAMFGEDFLPCYNHMSTYSRMPYIRVRNLNFSSTRYAGY